MTQEDTETEKKVPVQRTLAAILAADVAGYSRLAGADEEGTARMLSERRQLTDQLIEKYGGRIANTAGDSIIAEFGSSVEAVRCALDIQEGVRTLNLGIPSDRQINFRIGINVGDVIRQGDDLLGDGVNIAARLEGLSKPGGICLSGEVHDQVIGVLSIDFRPLGARRLKNIERRVRTYTVSESVDRNRWWTAKRLAFAGVGFVAILCLAIGLSYYFFREKLASVSAGVVPWYENRPAFAPPLPEMSDVVASGTWNGHAYYVVLTWGSDWQSSLRDAQYRGGYLVSITSEEENDFVYSLIKNDERLWKVFEDGGIRGPWIGMYQEPGAKEPDGGWVLVSGEPVTYTNFASGQPNNFANKAHVVRYFNAISQPSPFWDDHNGESSAFGYVMELDLDNPGEVISVDR